MRIIAIDPGYDRVGIAILEKASPRDKEQLIYSKCFTTSAKTPIYERLRDVGLEIARVIAEYSPEAMALETLFITKNQKTAMHVSEARGIILYEAAKAGLPIYEYTPPEIKIAVTGYGKSDKDQVIAMVEKLVNIGKKIAHDDEYDAIAVGLTCIACEYKVFHTR